MATMIPSFPYNFDPRSREDELFRCLQERLPQSYYVFHSFKMASLLDGTWKEKEIDFLIYHRDKGILVVEAKAGKVWCDQGIWRYENGNEMKDPFKQSDSSKWILHGKLVDMQKGQSRPIQEHLKFLGAVWFPSVSRKNLSRITFPQNADSNIVLAAEDLENPVPTLEKIFSMIPVTGVQKTTLTDEEHRYILDRLLCPSFNILPSKTSEADYARKRFDAMIAEQCNLLNYLEYQRSAVINGAAGTGKTMIALEKARRHSEKGEPVLFLCFNNRLKDYLERTYQYPSVSYFTIDGFACRECSTPTADFDFLETVLWEYEEGKKEFPYIHIIIDEGQDFGQTRIHADTILELLEDIVLEKKNGSFYVFYDRLQMVQSVSVPNVIENADCRLTLYKNCRNTKRIAETSFRPLMQKKGPKLFDSALLGDVPIITFCSKSETIQVLNKVIGQSVSEGYKDIQILSCAPESEGILRPYAANDRYVSKNCEVGYTTARKFKGLEADHVILVDVTPETIMENGLLFYVGSSRAKLKLTVIMCADDTECEKMVQSLGSVVKRKDPKRTLTKLLGCKQFDNG